MIKFAIRTSAVALLAAFSSSPVLGADAQSFVDLEASAGYSTNPLLVAGDSAGSGFGRVSAYGFHGWSTERSSTNLSAFVENSTYFRRYSNKQAFSLGASTSYRASETARLYGSLGFSGDVGGQLSSRFYALPAIPETVVPVDASAIGAAATPVTPNQIVVVDPILLGTSERVYRISADIGGDWTLSPRSTLTTAAGAQRVFTNSNAAGGDYNLYNGTLAYNQQLSERITVGGRLIASYADYTLGRSVSTIGPQATISAQLGPNWSASAAAGFVRSHFDNGTLGGASDSSIDLAVDGSICRQAEFERFCASIARRTQTAVYGGSPTSTSASVSYSRRLSARDQLQASLAAVRTGNSSELEMVSRSSFYSASASYNRQIGNRLSAGVNATARKLTNVGPDPKSDLGGSVFLRYRLGDLR